MRTIIARLLFILCSHAHAEGQIVDLQPPEPSQCETWTPELHLPFDQPTKGIVITAVGDNNPTEIQYVINLENKTICLFEAEDTGPKVHLEEISNCGKITNKTIPKIIEVANFVWKSCAHPERGDTYIHSTVPVFVRIFDHERSYQTMVTMVGDDLPLAYPHAPEEKLVKAIMDAADEAKLGGP